MDEDATIVECEHCGKPFSYSEVGALGWSAREPEDIDCPHCGKTYGTQRTSGSIKSSKLTPEEERTYLAGKPGTARLVGVETFGHLPFSVWADSDCDQ